MDTIKKSLAVKISFKLYVNLNSGTSLLTALAKAIIAQMAMTVATFAIFMLYVDMGVIHRFRNNKPLI